MEALGIVQARLSSTRLPAKVLADIGGEPMLALLLGRLGRSCELGQIVVATSTDPGDDPIEEVAAGLGVRVHRGPRDDVLTRFVDAAAGHDGPVARLTGDCPLLDPEVVDEVVRLFRSTPGCDYASNIEPRSFPDGLDAEVFSSETLRRADRMAMSPDDREHVTMVIRRDKDLFRHATLTSDEQLAGIRWTVDTADDLEFVRELVERLGERRYTAGMRELLAAVRQEPSLADFHGRRG